MTSLHYITSTDPDNYGNVKYSMTAVVSQPCQVRVSGLQYNAHFSITTSDDYIQVSDAENNEKYIYFHESGYYTIDFLPDTLKSLFEENSMTDMTFEVKDIGLLYMKGNYKILNATHRVKLLLGLYHVPQENFPIDLTEGYLSPSMSLMSFGNILYLESNLPSPVGIRGTQKNKEEYRSIVYKRSDYLYPGIPVNSRTPGPVVATKTENLTDLEFTLVDFMMVPVILHSPLTITLEVFYGVQAIPMKPNS